MAWNHPSTWFNGAVTAAQMNAQIRDNMNWLKGALAAIRVTSDTAPTNLVTGPTPPANPNDNDRWFETGPRIEWFWDATLGKWMSDIRELQFPEVYTTVAADGWRVPNPWAGIYKLYLSRLGIHHRVDTPNTSASYWSVRVRVAGTNEELEYLDTNGDAEGALVNDPQDLFMVRTTVDLGFYLSIAKAGGTATPGRLTLMAGMTYRLIRP